MTPRSRSVLALALAILLGGCGVKAPPRPAASAGVEGAPLQGSARNRVIFP